MLVLSRSVKVREERACEIRSPMILKSCLKKFEFSGNALEVQ